MKAIDKVMTPSEVTDRWGVQKPAVCEACRKGWVEARKAGKNWIIDRVSAENRWGKEQ